MKWAPGQVGTFPCNNQKIHITGDWVETETESSSSMARNLSCYEEILRKRREEEKGPVP